MSKVFFMMLFLVWMVWGGTRADDMSLMKEHEIADLVDRFDRDEPGDLGIACGGITICIMDIRGNIIRQTGAGDEYPYKNPPILEVFMKRSMFLLEIDGIYYYLYEFSQQEKKIPWTGNFFSEIFI